MTTPGPRNQKRQRKKEGHQRRRAAELEALRRQRRNRLIVRFALVAGLILAIAAVLAFVGGDDDDGDVAADDTTEDGSTTTATTATTVPPEDLTCEAPAAPQTDLSTKPTITPPAEMARDLTCFDHVVGDGEVVPRGATIRAHYVGVLRKDGTQFDASWDRGEPSEFSLDMVIPGWTQGIPGMKVGGRRELVIPSVMAYGAEGRAPSIGPDEDLVFIVDVVEIIE
jgi:FKBP-type peptidyl-prolyl cis-trans isomerase